LYRQLDKFDLARRDLAAAVRLDPNNVAAVSGLGVLTEYEGKPVLALGLYDQAAQLDPLDFMRHVRRCGALSDSGKYQLAQAACTDARRLKQDSEWVYVASGLVARAQGDLAASLRWNEAGLAVTRESMELLRYRLVDLEHLGMVNEARNLVSRADALNPGAVWIALSGVGLTLLEGRVDDARRQMDDLHFDAEMPARELLDAAMLRLLMHQPAEAERLLRLADESVDVEWTRLLNYADLRWGTSHDVTRASVDKASGRHESAAAQMRRLLAQLDELERNGVVSWGLASLRGDALAIIGDADGAVQALGRAVDSGWRRTYYVRRAPHFAPLLSRSDLQQVLNRADQLIAADRARYRIPAPLQ
jgi:tetratricopeptide (TPR) repeat protein